MVICGTLMRLNCSAVMFVNKDVPVSIRLAAVARYSHHIVWLVFNPVSDTPLLSLFLSGEEPGLVPTDAGHVSSEQ